MKKAMLVCFVLVLLLSVNFASAGWFSDFWGKITGEVVDEQDLDWTQVGPPHIAWADCSSECNKREMVCAEEGCTKATNTYGGQEDFTGGEKLVSGKVIFGYSCDTKWGVLAENKLNYCCCIKETTPPAQEELCIARTSGHGINIGVFGNNGMPRLVDRQTCLDIASKYGEEIENYVCLNEKNKLEDIRIEWGEEILKSSWIVDCRTNLSNNCSDGTAYGACSASKPKYCQDGNLIDDCSSCGCLLGQGCNQTSKNCHILGEPPTGFFFSINKQIGRVDDEFIVAVKGSSENEFNISMRVLGPGGNIMLEKRLESLETSFVTSGFSEGRYSIEFFIDSPVEINFDNILTFEIIGEGEECILFEQNNPSDNAFNLVFTAPFNEDNSSSNYNSIEELIQDVNETIELFFAEEPYRTYRSYFNIKIVEHDVNLGCFEPETDISFGRSRQSCDDLKTTDLIRAVCGRGEMVLFVKKGEPYSETPNDVGQLGEGFTYANVKLSYPPRTFLHEFGHSLASLDDEYVRGSWDIAGEWQHVNCDTLIDNVACPLWCDGPAKTIDEFRNINCSAYSFGDCYNHPPCDQSKSGSTFECINSLECTVKTTREECETFFGGACRWLYNDEKSGFEETPPKFYNSFCVPLYLPKINIGTGCINGTGCYAGCSIINSYRSVESGIMNQNVEGDTYGPFVTQLICDKLVQKTGLSIGVCNGSSDAARDAISKANEEECSQLGYRKDNQYCTDNLEWTNQKSADEACENNFECDSNLCINDKCISSSVFQRFLRWLNRIFG